MLVNRQIFRRFLLVSSPFCRIGQHLPSSAIFPPMATDNWPRPPVKATVVIGVSLRSPLFCITDRPTGFCFLKDREGGIISIHPSAHCHLKQIEIMLLSVNITTCTDTLDLGLCRIIRWIFTPANAENLNISADFLSRFGQGADNTTDLSTVRTKACIFLASQQQSRNNLLLELF